MLSDPVPPGHGEAENAPAQPAKDRYCFCGRPLRPVTRASRTSWECPTHGNPNTYEWRSEVDEEDCGYDLNDPKHPTYHETSRRGRGPAPRPLAEIHGLRSTFTNRGCRCQRCRAANRRYQASRRGRKSGT